MKNVLRIYKRDLKSIFTNWVALLVVGGLLILPSLYGWFNIKASWDPYGNTNGIKVAVVNEDMGAKLNNKDYNMGEEIINSLKENNKIGWQFVSREEALNGVENGKYYASIEIPEDFSKDVLSITASIITKPTLIYTVNEKTNAIAPKITDKGVSSIKEEVSSEIVETIDGVIFKIINKLGIEITNSKDKIKNAVNMLQQINNNIDDIEDVVNKAYDGTYKIEDISKKLQEAMPVIQDKIKETKDTLDKAKTYFDYAEQTYGNLEPTLRNEVNISYIIISGINERLQNINGESATEQLLDFSNSTKATVDNLNTSVDSIINLLTSINSLINNTNINSVIDNLNSAKNSLQGLSGGIDSITNNIKDNKAVSAQVINNIKTEVNKANNILGYLVNNYDSNIKPAMEELVQSIKSKVSNGETLINKANEAIPEITKILPLIEDKALKGNEIIGVFKNELPTIKEKLATFSEKVQGLDNDELIDKVLDLMLKDWKSESKFLASPIDIEENKLFSIPNYGSAMSPFFTTLSLWVGALLLVSLLSVDAAHMEGISFKPIEEYLGKYLTFISLSIIQGLIAALGDIYILHAYVKYPIYFILFSMIISIVFTTIVYTMVSLLGNIGKAVGVVFLVLQVSASGGTFPVEVMPKFFQVINPLLPFKYAIGALREFVAGIVPELLITNTFCLSLYFIIFIFLGIVFKKILSSFTSKFAEKLNKSGLISH